MTTPPGVTPTAAAARRWRLHGAVVQRPDVAAATEMPVSVLDNVAIRWGGRRPTTNCPAGAAIDVAQLGRLPWTRAGDHRGPRRRGGGGRPLPGLGAGGLADQVRRQRLRPRASAAAGDIVSSRFESSLGKALALTTTKGVHVYGNELAARTEILGTGGMTREAADVRGNAVLLGEVRDPTAAPRTTTTWPGTTGDQPASPPGWPLNPATVYHPRITPSVQPAHCSVTYQLWNTAYWTRVLPMLAQAPELPEAGLGAVPAPPIGVLLAQTLGMGASEFAYNPSAQADPVNSATGSFVTAETDAVVPAPGIGVEVGRGTTTPSTPRPGTSARAGSSGYHSRIAGRPRPGSEPASAVPHAGDGQQVRYVEQVDGGYLGDPGATSKLRRNSEDEWVLTTRPGVVRVFGPAGRLLTVTDRHENTVRLSYDGQGRLTEVGNGARSVSLT